MSPREDLLRLLTLTAHELRNPLSVASGYLRMLTSERLGPLNEAQRKAAVTAAKSCEQLLALSSDLSAIARLERGEAALTRVPVRASTLVAEAIAAYPETETHPVTITAQGDDDAMVCVDPIRARHTLQALITAVARAAPDRSMVVVSRVVHTHDGRPWLYLIIAPDGQADAELVTDHRHAEPFDEWEGGLGVVLPLALRFLRLEGGDVRGLDTDCPGLVVSIPTVSDARAAS